MSEMENVDLLRNNEKINVKNRLNNLTDSQIADIISSQISRSQTCDFAFLKLFFDNPEVQGKLKENETFIDAIKKYPIVDLGFGNVIDALRSARIFGKYGCKKYMGVDKYRPEKWDYNPHESDGMKMQLTKQDMIIFLRSLPDKYANIAIAGFDTAISRPTRSEDRYRAMLLNEMSRVIPADGFLLCINSKLKGEYENIKLTPTDFDFIEDEIMGIDKILYAKQHK